MDAERFIDQVLERNLSVLGDPFVPMLVHHDFDPGNVNFAAASATYEPSGVFDLFEAYLGDAEEDLVCMLWSVNTQRERQAFLAAYAHHRPLRHGVAERLELYTLADWLVIWDCGKRNRLRCTTTCRPSAASRRAIPAPIREVLPVTRQHRVHFPWPTIIPDRPTWQAWLTAAKYSSRRGNFRNRMRMLVAPAIPFDHEPGSKYKT